MKTSTPRIPRNQLAFGLMCILSVCLGMSCATEGNRQAVKIGRNMDDAEQYLEEYGVVNISVPLLSTMGPDFKFDLKQGASNYYADAKTQVQGGAASFQQTINSLGISAQAQIDPTIAGAYASQLKDYFSSLQRYDTKQNLQDQAAQAQLQANLVAANTNTSSEAKQAAIAQALQAYSQQYVAPTNSPQYPTDTQSNTNLPALPTGTVPRPGVTNVLAAQQFQGFQGLLNGLNVQPTVNDRFAVITAAGDVATESIFRHFLGGTPPDPDRPTEKLYLGFSTISVDPGWRTSKGWAAEAVVKAELCWRKPRTQVLEDYISRSYRMHKDDVGAIRLLAKLLKDMGRKTAIGFSLDPELAVSIMKERMAEQILAGEKLGDITNKCWESLVKNYELTDFADKVPAGAIDQLTNFCAQMTAVVSLVATGKDIDVDTLASINHIPKYFVERAVRHFGVGDEVSREMYNWGVRTDADITNPSPVSVTVISPLIDTQVMDLSSSIRSQNEFALALSFALESAGRKGAAQVFEQFVRNNQADVRTRTPQPTVNAFSDTDGRFGFQVAPRVEAIGDLSGASGKASQILPRQTFPALLILRFPEADLRARIIYEATNDQLTLVEPYIRCQQLSRWTPLKHNFFPDRNWYQPINWFHTPLTEKKRLLIASRLEDAIDMLGSTSKPLHRTSNETSTNTAELVSSVRKTTASRIEYLAAQLTGRGAEGSVSINREDLLPNTPSEGMVPSVTNVIPTTVTYQTNAPVNFVLFGTGLDQVSLNETAHPVLPESEKPTGTSLQYLGQALVLTTTLTGTNSPLVFALPLKRGGKILTLPLQVKGTAVRVSKAGIASIVPVIGWIDRPTVFSVEGSNFLQNGQSAVTGVTVGGRLCDILSVGTNSIVVSFPASVTNEMVTNAVRLAVATQAGVTEATNLIAFTMITNIGGSTTKTNTTQSPSGSGTKSNVSAKVTVP